MTTNTKTKASYITDFGIRIYAPKVNKNYWRISYVDQEGKLRGTTPTSERLAMERASEIGSTANRTWKFRSKPSTSVAFRLKFAYLFCSLKKSAASKNSRLDSEYAKIW